MTAGTKISIVSFCILLIFIFLCVIPLKTEAYTVQKIEMVREKYIAPEPYETTEQYTVPVTYTYTAPCKDEEPRYGYRCCGVNAQGWISVPGDRMPTGQYPPPFDPAYAPYANRPQIRYCEYTGIREETRTRTVTKVRYVEKERVVPKIINEVKYRKRPIISFLN